MNGFKLFEVLGVYVFKVLYEWDCVFFLKMGMSIFFKFGLVVGGFLYEDDSDRLVIVFVKG